MTKRSFKKPSNSSPEVISRDELESLWSNNVISLVESKLNFDISWFIPEFVCYKGLLSEVLVLFFFLQILALALPLFFQVLVHNALSTLDDEALYQSSKVAIKAWQQIQASTA